MSSLSKGIGLLFGLAIISVIATKPGFIAPTFTGAANVIKAANSPTA